MKLAVQPLLGMHFAISHGAWLKHRIFPPPFYQACFICSYIEASPSLPSPLPHSHPHPRYLHPFTCLRPSHCSAQKSHISLLRGRRPVGGVYWVPALVAAPTLLTSSACDGRRGRGQSSGQGGVWRRDHGFI